MRRREDVESVKAALTDIKALCAELGLDARREQGTYKVACVWHDEKTPSLSLSLGPDGTMRVHCFGCGQTGDVLTLIAAARGLDVRSDFRDVLQQAAAIAHVAVGRDEGGRTSAPPRSPPALRLVDPAVSDLRFAELVAPLFHIGALGERGAGDVEDYLHDRGLLDQARLDGWAALPRASKQEALVRMLVEGLGEDDLLGAKLVRTGEGRREFVWSEHRLVIPWRDPSGAIVNVQRRLLRPPSGPREPRYVFPSGRRPRHPYGIEQLATAPSDTPVVFVEGAIDVLALRVLDAGAGVRRVVLGLPGLDAWQSAWAALARGRTACVAVDGDRAGEERVEEIASDLFDAKARRVVRLRPKGGKDWADVLRARRA